MGFVDEPRLLVDVRTVLAEVGRRVAAAGRAPVSGQSCPWSGRLPWAYLWAVTIPCDGCARAFPLHRVHGAPAPIQANPG